MRLPHRLLPAVLAAGLPAAAADVTPPSGPARAPRLVPTAATPPPSTFFATTSIGSRATTQANGDGDLWANCWSDDDHVYTAHGDGKGFGGTFSDIGVNRVTGMPGSLAGTTLALGDQVGQVWTANHTRKPTGMACVDGALYLAVQDLALDFDDAPSATIARSNDKGSTWTWNRSAPMFGGGAFTTIMFLDYGKDYANAIDGYVYAYGLDHNQRDSFANRVPDPVDVYLGRVPAPRSRTARPGSSCPASTARATRCGRRTSPAATRCCTTTGASTPMCTPPGGGRVRGAVERILVRRTGQVERLLRPAGGDRFMT